MSNIDNQEAISLFVAQNLEDLSALSGENPELFNAVTDALDYLSKAFGTGATELPRLPKELPKTPRAPKTKRGSKDVKVMVNAKDLIVAGQYFVHKNYLKSLSNIDKIIYKISKVNRTDKTIDVNWTDEEGNYQELLGLYTIEEVEDKFLRGTWIPTLEDGTPMNLEFFVKKKEEEPTKEEEIKPMKPEQQQPAIPTGMGQVATFNVAEDGFVLHWQIDTNSKGTISGEEDLVFKKDRKFLDTQTLQVLTITEFDDNKVMFDYVDMNEDIQGMQMTKKYFLDEINKQNLLEIFETSTPNLYNVYGLDVIESQPQPQAQKPEQESEELADLKLELETQEILALTGDEDAEKEVKKLKRRIKKLENK